MFVWMIFSPCIRSCPLNISWTAQPHFIKLSMVVYYHQAMCHAEKLIHYLQCQGHIKGLYNENTIIFTISSKLLVCLQTNLVWEYSTISQSVLWKNGITAFKVKVTAKVHNVGGCLSRWYILNCRTFCYQTWYGDAVSWARVSCKKRLVCYFQQGFIW